ncbi:TPA: hypothetical protein ACPP5G_001391 [Haemophilus influenzae]|uniref:hypothetical protein n=1 Tax=Haemophilus influenzae TaxID=727 RepID=UPI0013A6CC37|nr:hypothetical protein [Haemophilus influenzae]
MADCYTLNSLNRRKRKQNELTYQRTCGIYYSHHHVFDFISFKKSRRAETQCELKGGIYENGVCLPPNLTLTAEKELQAYTAQKQAEINRTWSK